MGAPKPLYSDVHGQLCILSVDDDQVNLMVIEQLLQPQGWKIVSVLDGAEALEELEGETWPDFVLLDYTLHSGDSGDEVCRKMRKIFGDVPVPIVMCTALTAGHSALDECISAGATDYLLKPYEREKMVEKIEKFCGAKAHKAHAAATPPAPAPAAAPPVPAAATASSDCSSLVALCKRLDLEYVGKKLEAAGFTTETIKSADDTSLRKAGIVVKSQRDKVLEAVKNL